MAKKIFKRIHHPYWLWEEVKFNMWGEADDKSAMLQKAIEFTGDWNLYGSYMERVAMEWKYSCENSLTDYGINRRAWIGHAACALAIRCPEDITRKAWGYLTDEQRVLADRKADEAIALWEELRVKNNGLREDVDGQMLFGWDT